jgi:tetratricopeptide (TPR) repeat protein
MASLKVLNEQPEKIVLGKGGVGGAGNLIGLIIFAIAACAGLSSFFEQGGESNPIVVIVGLIIALALLSSALSALRSTRVVIDGNQRVAARTESFLFFPVNRQEMALNLIRDVQVTTSGGAGARRQSALPVWQVQLQGTDGSTLVVNDHGTRAEMQALAQKIGAMMNRPVRDAGARVKTTTATATTTAPSAGLGSLIENLGAFAQSLAESSTILLPEGAAPQPPPMPYAPRGARTDAQRLAADAAVNDTSARMAADQVAAFESDAAVQARMSAAQTAASAPYLESSARVMTQQAQADARMGYSMPPLLTMPQMPALLSFAPAMNLPSLPPMGSSMSMYDVPASPTAEIKLVENETMPSSASSADTAIAGTDDSAAQYRRARQMYAARNFQDAQAAYERALDLDPGNAAIHNDLGVLFYQQNKMREAERAFRQTIALDPFSTAGRYNLGLTLQRMGKSKQALEQFRLGARNAPRAQAQDFQNAMQGVLHAPISSS